MSKVLAVIAGILNLTGYALYNSQIFFGNSKPSLAAWAVWGFLVVLNVSSYFKMSGDWIMTIIPATSAFACLTTTVVVILKGGGFGTLAAVDWIVLAFGLIACLVWYKRKKADHANVIIVSAVAIGFIPIYYGMSVGTVKETPLAWCIWTASYALGAVVVLLRWKEEPEKKNKAQMMYPATCVMLHLTVALLCSLTVREVLSAYAGIIFTLGFVPYIRYVILNRHDTDRGKPSKVGWLIGAILDSLILAGTIASHSVNGQMIGAIVGVWVVVALAFRYGTPNWTRLDKMCLAGAVVGIVLWLRFSNPTLAIFTGSAVIFVGSIPTFILAYEKPQRENRTAWTMFWVSCVLAVMAIPKWDWDNATQPVTFLLIETLMMGLLWLRPRQLAACQT